MKHGENGGRRVACLELGCERMCQDVLLCMFFVHIQCVVEDESEVGGGRHAVSMRHEGESRGCVRAEMIASSSRWAQKICVQGANGLPQVPSDTSRDNLKNEDVVGAQVTMPIAGDGHARLRGSAWAILTENLRPSLSDLRT